MTRTLAIVAAAIALIGGGAYWYTSQTVATTDLVGAAQAQDAAEVDTSGIQEMALGAEDAPIEIIEYASFTCPHCANFHETVFDQLKENYIDTGKVRFVYREVYFDRFGLWAGMVARCGGEQRYFGLADMIYDTQTEWLAGGSDPAQIADNLRRIGRTAGISDEQLNTCLNDGETAQALVALYQKNAEADGINSTPSFVIDGEKYSNMNYADFSELLDEKLAQ